MKFQDKVALVTGASRGIGAATAKLFAQEGAKVALNYHVSDYEPDAEANAAEVKTSIESNGGQATTIEVDVSKEEAVKSLITKTIETYGRIDILVNNAGIVYDVPISERTLEQWHTTFDTNVLGTYLCSKYVSDEMMKNKSGKIVNVASTSGIDAHNPESIDYDATKASIITLTRNFAKTLAPYVNVNAVAPGWVNTEMNKDLPDDFVKQETDKIFIKRFAEPEEIAKLITFLASEDAAYLDATVIVADGGRGY